MPGEPEFSLTQLRYFLAIVESGSVSAAAEDLHITQSTLSTAILKLERRLGVQLFIRRRAVGMSVSPDGHRFAVEARKLLRHAHDVSTFGRGLGVEVEGSVGVGCFAPLTPFCIPPVVERLRAAHPGLRAEIVEGDVGEVHRRLLSGQCELAVSFDLDRSPEISFEAVAPIRPHVVVGAGHRLAAAGRVRLADLADEPWIEFGLAESIRYMEGMFVAVGAPVPAALRATGYETVRGLVAAGQGFSILMMRSASPVTAYGGRVSVLEIADPVPELDIGIATVDGLWRSRRVEVVAEHVREVLHGLAATRTIPA